VNDLERLYRQLVATLSASGAARWQDPMRLSDLLNVLPYRAAKRVLSIDSSEEFELLMLRLAGGESGYMSTEPEAVGQRFALEAVSTNPDLGVLREFKDALLMFAPGPLMKVLSGSTGDEAYAPPAPPTRAPAPAPPAAQAAPEPPRRAAPSPQPAAAVTLPAPRATPLPQRAPVAAAPAPGATPAPRMPASPACTACGRALPAGGAVNFCPYCGEGQAMGRCARCGADAELGWHFCATCGVGLPWGTFR
jgi:hypothetical protein